MFVHCFGSRTRSLDHAAAPLFIVAWLSGKLLGFVTVPRLPSFHTAAHTSLIATVRTYGKDSIRETVKEKKVIWRKSDGGLPIHNTMTAS